VLELSKYATISVPVEVKTRLEEAKGDREWGDFLLEMYTEGELTKRKKAFDELTRLVTKEDLEAMRESSKEFRENFKLK
jgi:hypothetical protein